MVDICKLHHIIHNVDDVFPFDDLIWVMGLEVLLKIILVMVFLQERKVCCLSSKGGYTMPQRKFTARKPAHVSDGVADEVLQHICLRTKCNHSLEHSALTASQPDSQTDSTV